MLDTRSTDRGHGLEENRVTLRHADDNPPFSGGCAHRAIATAQRDGPEQGLQEILAIAGREWLYGYPFYAAALGELELRSAGASSRANIFVKRLLWPVTRRSSVFWISVSKRAKKVRRGRPTTN